MHKITRCVAVIPPPVLAHWAHEPSRHGVTCVTMWAQKHELPLVQIELSAPAAERVLDLPTQKQTLGPLPWRPG